VIEELTGATRQSAEEAIRRARDKLVPLTYPQRSEEKKRTKSNLARLQESSEKPTPGLEPGTPSLRGKSKGGKRG